MGLTACAIAPYPRVDLDTTSFKARTTRLMALSLLEHRQLANELN
jgi:hypothetical protein